MDPVITVISPVYNNENGIELFVQNLVLQLDLIGVLYEIILIEDGSRDQTWQSILKIALNEPAIRAVRLSRNFGQHAAILAGIDLAKGEYIVVMDSDLQDEPSYISEMFQKAKSGYDVVHTYRSDRKQSVFYRFASFIVYRLLSVKSDLKYTNWMGNFKLISRKALNMINQIKSVYPLFEINIQFIGLNQTAIPVIRNKRLQGRSSYSFISKLRFVKSILLNYSELIFSLFLKFSLLNLCAAIVVFIFYLLYYIDSLFAVIWIMFFVLLSALFFCTGILGYHLRTIIRQSRNWPVYLIREKYSYKDFNS